MNWHRAIPISIILVAGIGIYHSLTSPEEMEKPAASLEPDLDREPDFFMTNVVNNEYNEEGIREGLFYADRANYFLDTKDVLLIKPRISATRENGDTFVARSNRAFVHNSKVIDLLGSVRLVRSTPAISQETVITMPFAKIDLEKQVASTPAKTQIQSVYGVTTSMGAIYWYGVHRAELSSKVEGLLKPPSQIIQMEENQ